MKKLWTMLMATICVGMAQAQTTSVALTSGGDMESENTCVMVRTDADMAQIWTEPEVGIGKDGTKGVSVTAKAGMNKDWDVGLYIVFNQPVYAGDEITVEFDYKATSASTASTQSHGEPGQYHYWDAIGNISFTEEWQHYTKTLTVTDEMDGNDDTGMKTICINVARNQATGEAHPVPTTFYLDNVVVTTQAQTWKHIVSGGDLEGENQCIEVQCNTEGYVVEKGYPAPVAGAGMEGTKGIAVVCPASSTQMWDPQMWIVLNEPVTEGERIKVDFDYKATMPMNVTTNFQNADGMIYDGDGIGILECNEEWQHFSQTISLPSANQWVSASEVSRICFLLGNMDGSRTEDVTFYIDNVSVQKEEWENAEVTGECGVGLKWSFNQATGVLTIDGEGTMDPYQQVGSTEGKIPNTPWYKYHEQIKSLYVNASITSTSNYAFAGLDQLTYVKLPSTLKTMGVYTFYDCTSLSTITLPASVTTIGEQAFAGCQLTDVTCKSTTAASCAENAFTIDATTSKILSTLHLPEDADEAYRNTTPWSLFQNYDEPASTNPAKQDYSIYIPNKTFARGETLVVPIMLKNIGEVDDFTATFKLPEGFSFMGIVQNSGFIPDFEVPSNIDRWEKRGPWVSLSMHKRTDNLELVYRASDNPAVFKKGDDLLMVARFSSDTNQDNGEYQGEVNFSFNEGAITGTSKFTFTVKDLLECTRLKGDVNEDGKVSINDVNILIEILKKLK